MTDITPSDENISYRHRTSLLLVSGAFFCIATYLLLVLVGFVTQADSQPFDLLALGLLLLLITLLPAFAIMRHKSFGFDLFNPIFYAAWYFFIPQFTLASFIIVFTEKITSPDALLLDRWSPRITAMEFAIIGAIGLIIGFGLPIGNRISRAVPHFATLDLPPSELKFAAFVLILIGAAAQIFAFIAGVSGYVFITEIPVFGATVTAFGDLVTIGIAIVWFSYSRKEKGWSVLILLSLVFILFNTAIIGTRSSLIKSALLIVSAYQYSQPNINARRLWRWGTIIILALFIGLLFGSLFRIVKVETAGRAAQISLDDALLTSQQAVTKIEDLSLSGSVQFVLDRLSERIDGISSLAVIAVKAPSLKNEEINLGIDQNILNDLATAFIPRFIWHSKPVVGVHEQIGNLYFGTSQTSPATTYMGDLYRNFGVWGIPFGMLGLGIVLRVIYAWLIESQPRSALRVGLFMLLGWQVVNYEGLYSLYIPALIRAIFIGLVAVFIVKIMQTFYRRT